MKIKHDKIREKQGKSGKRHSKTGKILTFLHKDTDLGAPIAPQKGLLGPANRI